MPRDRLYALIDAARDGGGPESPSVDPDALREVVAALDPDELSGFVLAFDDELIRLNRWSVWGAGYVANGGMGDDDFHYFRCWLIGKGRSAVDAVLEDPDALADHLDAAGLENEGLEYVGLDLLEERGLPDPRDDADRAYADDEPSGQPFDEGAVEAAYPRTAAASG